MPGCANERKGEATHWAEGRSCTVVCSGEYVCQCNIRAVLAFAVRACCERNTRTDSLRAHKLVRKLTYQYCPTDLCLYTPSDVYTHTDGAMI